MRRIVEIWLLGASVGCTAEPYRDVEYLLETEYFEITVLQRNSGEPDRLGRSKGRDIPAPLPAASGQDLEELELFLRDAELHLDPSINMSKWDGTAVALHGGSSRLSGRASSTRWVPWLRANSYPS